MPSLPHTINDPRELHGVACSKQGGRSVKESPRTRKIGREQRKEAGDKCRQTLLCPLCLIQPMIPESYMEWPAQSKGEDPSKGDSRRAGDTLTTCKELAPNVGRHFYALSASYHQ